MISRQAVLEVALCFAGRELTDGEENVLSILCGGALEQWLGRLREDVTEEDCQDLLVVASAWTALAGMTGALEQSQPTPLSFSAGDLTVRARRRLCQEPTKPGGAADGALCTGRVFCLFGGGGMSFAGSFQAIAARYGQTVTLWRDGEIVGTGRAVLRPLLGEARQFVPTDLGLRRQEMVLCLAEASLPLEEQPGDWVLQQGERFYGVRNVSAVEAGRERIYWRAVLVRQEGDVT